MGGGSSYSIVETELQSVKFFQDNAHCYIIESSMEKNKDFYEPVHLLRVVYIN